MQTVLSNHTYRMDTADKGVDVVCQIDLSSMAVEQLINIERMVKLLILWRLVPRNHSKSVIVVVV